MEPEQEGLRVNRVVGAGLAEDVISGKRHWRKSVPLKGKVTVPRGEGMTRASAARVDWYKESGRVGTKGVQFAWSLEDH